MQAITITIEPISVPHPCSAVFLRTGKFPVAEAEKQVLRSFWTRLSNAISAQLRLNLEVFLQLEFIRDGREIYDQHATDWASTIGLGVWPNRPPPEPRRVADAFKIAQYAQRMGRFPPLMYSVLRIGGEPRARAAAGSLLLGTGMVVGMWATEGGEEFLHHTREELLPPIKSKNFRNFSFYMPLLDFASLRDRQLGELERWLCGSSLYMRESPDDNATIMLATMPLVPLLEEAGAKPTDSGRWLYS
jgi:hypothetical protein